MRGERTDEMDEAWLKYLVDRGDSKGWNPRTVFFAGWLAAEDDDE